MDKSRDIASRASTSIAAEGSDGISVVRSLPWYLIVIANLAKGAARAAGCDPFSSRRCATPTEPSLTSAVRRPEQLGKIIRRKLMPWACDLEVDRLSTQAKVEGRKSVTSSARPPPTS